MAAHKADALDASQQKAGPEHASSQAAVMPPDGNELSAQHDPFADAAKAKQSLSTAEVSVCSPKDMQMRVERSIWHRIIALHACSCCHLRPWRADLERTSQPIVVLTSADMLLMRYAISKGTSL